MRQRPGATFTATAPFASGLVGTVGVRIRTDDGADFLARTTAGITADVTVGGRSIYLREFTAPVSQGSYVLVWDDGTNIVTEELEVSYSLADSPAPAGNDLCTLEDVKSYLPGYKPNDVTDAKLQQLITGESEQFTTDSYLEFVGTEVSQPADRVFEVWPAWGQRVYIGTLASIEDLDVALVDSAGAETAVDLADVTPLYGPRRQPIAPWHPITALEIRTPEFSAGQLVRVTGNWGFAAIPALVREAVAATVILRYVSDVAAAGTDLSDALDNVNIRGLVARRQDALAAMQELQPPVLA